MMAHQTAVKAMIALVLLAGVLAEDTTHPTVVVKKALHSIVLGGQNAAADGGSASTAPAAAAAQQPTPRAPEPQSTRAAANAVWLQTASTAGFNALANVRLLSPLCANGTEATSCESFSGNTAVVVSSVMPAIGTSASSKTTQCFCDFRNTVAAYLPPNGNEVYRCAAYCA